MPSHTPTRRQRLTRHVTRRVEQARTEPDRGSHVVEYAIGIGLGAAAIIAVYVAYRAGLATIISNWIFTVTG